MKKIEVFDPAMCCSTGICGSSTDPTLVTFASDLEWLKQQGVDVKRYGLSFEPAEFAKNEAVKCALQCEGNKCLPIIYVDNKIVSKSTYLSRQILAELCGIEYNEEDAPPVHREENCCCGEDCDCAHIQEAAAKTYNAECDCTNAAAEDNCICGPECECQRKPASNNFRKILILIVVILIIAVIYILK